jgi:hypothetical protein
VDTIPWPVLGPASGWAVSALLGLWIVRAVMNGNWVSRREHEEKIHEANEWRTEGRIKDATITELITHNNLLKELAATVNHVMRLLQSRAESEDP